MLFHFRGDVEVALYAVGVRLSEALALIPEAVLVTLFPLLVATESDSSERFRHTYRIGFKYLAALGIFVAFLVSVLREPMIALLFGSTYRAAAVPVAILAWNTAFGYVGAVYLSLFIAQSRQRPLLLVSAASLAVNVLLNLAWIPPYGASGAAAATLLANAAGFGCWLLLPPTRAYMVTCLRESWRPLLAATFVAALLHGAAFDGFAAAVIVAGLYPALLWAFGGITAADVHLVRRLYASH
jgi:O-antigen/teichoic acid export membrane protein